MKRWQKFLITIFIIIPIVLFLLATTITYFVYSYYFSKQMDTSFMEPQIEYFPGLMVEEGSFEGNKGQRLNSYLYYKEDLEAKGIVLISHGLGSGQGNYIDLADYFTDNDYYAYAYDASGSGKSQGPMGGMSQGIIDLEYAIDDVKTREELKDLPIMLIGHSFGGHNSGAVLNTRGEDISSFAIVSGWDDQIDMMVSSIFGKYHIDNPLFRLIFTIVENIKFGQYANYTVVEGANKSQATGIFIHSKDDQVVPVEIGYDIFYDQLSSSDSYEFILFEDRGHSNILNTPQSIAESEDFMEGLSQYKSTIGEDFGQDDLVEYFDENYQYDSDRLNTKLMEEILQVFNDSL